MGIIHQYIGEEHDFDWVGVAKKLHQAAGVRGVTAKVLVGPTEVAPNFRIRYFRVEPWGCTSLDRHPHDHGVFISHGRASVLLGGVMRSKLDLGTSCTFPAMSCIGFGLSVMSHWAFCV